MTEEKMYIWGGKATPRSAQPGFTLFGHGWPHITSVTVLAPSRDEAAETVTSLLGTWSGKVAWDCDFTSVTEVYARSQILESCEVKS